jgi:hypothetical protein
MADQDEMTDKENGYWSCEDPDGCACECGYKPQSNRRRKCAKESH